MRHVSSCCPHVGCTGRGIRKSTFEPPPASTCQNAGRGWIWQRGDRRIFALRLANLISSPAPAQASNLTPTFARLVGARNTHTSYNNTLCGHRYALFRKEDECKLPPFYDVVSTFQLSTQFRRLNTCRYPRGTATACLAEHAALCQLPRFTAQLIR